MPLNLDRSMFVPFNDCGPLGFEAVVNPSLSRAEIVDRIGRGDFAHDAVIRIVEFNAAEGWSRDVTAEIFAEIAAASAKREAA